MNSEYFSEIREDLNSGAKDYEHPFHCFTLGTVGLERMARLRTLVLREVTADLKLRFFTDRRSKKIMHLKENNKVGLLFYNPKKQLQVKIEGLAEIFKDQEYLAPFWKEINAEGQKDYTTVTPPGSELTKPEALSYLPNTNFFCMVEITPYKIEYLKLGKPHHLRIRFSTDGDHWSSEYLVP